MQVAPSAPKLRPSAMQLRPSVKLAQSATDWTISFGDLAQLLRRFCFAERRWVSHTIFTREGIPEMVNLQPLRNGMAKAYHVKQVRQPILEYRLAGDDSDG
jgi:hypothetical protein